MACLNPIWLGLLIDVASQRGGEETAGGRGEGEYASSPLFFRQPSNAESWIPVILSVGKIDEAGDA